MKESNATPPVVSKRNHFRSLDEFTDIAMHEIGRRGIFGKDMAEQDQLRTAIQYALRHFLANINDAFRTACASAMDQAERLIDDPDFYDNRKKRLKNERTRQAKEHARQVQQRQDREIFGPTPEEVAYKRNTSIRMIAYHEQEAARHRQELATLPNIVGPQIKGSAITQ